MQFAEDILLIMDHPEGVISMIKTLENFVKNKLTINIKKDQSINF